jgi:hypothetical protein
VNDMIDRKRVLGIRTWRWRRSSPWLYAAQLNVSGGACVTRASTRSDCQPKPLSVLIGQNLGDLLSISRFHEFAAVYWRLD